MPSAKHDVRLTPGALPKSYHERLLILIFGGAAADTNSPAGSPFSAGDPGGLEVTRADAGARQANPAEAGRSSVPARPGSANGRRAAS